MTEKSDITRHFDDYAASWDERIRQHPYQARFLVVKRMIEALPNPDAVLDVGCGTGDYAVLFEPNAYLGIDISPLMIERCRTLYPRYRFDVADGDRLSIPDNHADIVLDVAVIEYYVDALPHILELARVTKPGGSVIIVAPNGDNKTKKLATAIDRGAARIGGRRGNAAASQKIVQHHRRGVREISALAEKAGLRSAEHEFASIYLLPEIRPFVGVANMAISKAISGRPAWRWITSWSATNLIMRFVKPG